jgi:Asp-tRNA(Asn)/Glu-tRNA(Gln) amidotransferase A subunit family amidase
MKFGNMEFSAIWDEIRSEPNDLLDYLDLLEQRFNEIEPDLKSFLPESGRFNRLRKEASDLVSKFTKGDKLPLFGLIVGVKDIFHVDGMKTKAGSGVLPAILAGKEAKSVSVLKEAGALIMGKTVTTQFAYFSPGPTTNPHNSKHTPGGSSSGSAAAVGGNIVPMALGTQTIGSIVRPASFCGAVGFKPTYDRISREGVIPLSQTMDHIGFFTNEIESAERIAASLINDWDINKKENMTPVIGIPEGPYLELAGDEMGNILLNAIKILQLGGFEIKFVPVFSNFDEIVNHHRIVVAAEAANVHSEWYANYPEGYKKPTIELILNGKTQSQENIESALIGKENLQTELENIMETEKIDCWLAPSAVGEAPLGLESTGDPIMNLPWTQVGFPAINLPYYMNDNNMPLGLQIIGKPYHDESLFGYGKLILKSLRN